MDSSNGGSIGGFGADGIPVGFGMTLAMNERALSSYAGLTEAQKEEVILRAKDAASKEDMERIVNSLVPEEQVKEVMDDTGIM